MTVAAVVTGASTGAVWHPRWWVAVTTVVTYCVAIFGVVHEVLAASDRAATLAALSGLIVATTGLAVLDKFTPKG